MHLSVEPTAFPFRELLTAGPPGATGSETDDPWWWFVVGLVVLVVVTFVVSVLIGKRRLAKQAAAEADELAEHHRPLWATDPATFEPEPRHWPLAAASVFALCGEGPWDVLHEPDPDDSRASLVEAWGIRSRPQLLAQLHSLLVSGHRSRFIGEQVVWSGVSAEEAEQIEAELRDYAEESVDGAEMLWRFRRVRANDRSIQSVNFTAWDLVRFTMLCRAGATLGLLSEAEAEDFMALACDDLHGSYVSWAELGDHFRRARWYWASVSGEEEAYNDRHDESRQRSLLQPQVGPWSRVPWTMPHPPNRLLLVDALLAEELIEPLTQEEYDAASGWAQLLDDAVQDRLDRPRNVRPL